MPRAVTPFRTIVEEVARRHRAVTSPPTSTAILAKRCGMSRTHLYQLMSGTRGAPAWTIEKIAKGLSVDADAVAVAIAETVAAYKKAQADA